MSDKPLSMIFSLFSIACGILILLPSHASAGAGSAWLSELMSPDLHLFKHLEPGSLFAWFLWLLAF